MPIKDFLQFILNGFILLSPLFIWMGLITFAFKKLDLFPKNLMDVIALLIIFGFGVFMEYRCLGPLFNKFKGS